MIKTYFQLTKPGIIFGNVITAAAGFFLASKGDVNWWLFLAAIAGLSFVIASACVSNNYIDREIDEKMARTKKRALVKKSILARNAIIFGVVLGLTGFLVLIVYTNLLTAFIAFIGFFFYVVMYSIWKRRSEYGTIVGSVSGAVPPVVGYCAVTNRFDVGALLLFVILVLWQMPHFYAIAIYRLDDYAAAGLPVLPVKEGIFTAKIYMLFYIVAFIAAALLLSAFGYTGYAYLVAISLLGFMWLGMCIKGFKTGNAKRWARGMFVFSLVIIMLLSLMLSVEGAVRL